MKRIKNQRGLTAFGWLFVLSTLGFALLTVTKVGPHYLDNRFVVASLKDLAEDPEFPTMSPNDIRDKLRKNFQINNVRGKPVQSVKVERNSKATIVTIAYEERIPFIANADVLLSFKSVLNSNDPENCCRIKQE